MAHAVVMSNTVLVIDDDPDIRESLKELLALENFECELADSGEQGLSIARVLQPQLVVTDIRLPDISGYQVCQALKRDAQSTCVIMITGRFTEPEDRVQGFEMGADDFLC